jgi:hypothetical protein
LQKEKLRTSTPAKNKFGDVNFQDPDYEPGETSLNRALNSSSDEESQPMRRKRRTLPKRECKVTRPPVSSILNEIMFANGLISKEFKYSKLLKLYK